MPSPPSRADALLEQLFELPAEQWPERLETLCREHPSQADELRRRHELLAATGLDRDPAPQPAARMPDRFGDFRLLRRLGCGGMGMVFAAEQVSLGREVAIKFVRPELSFSAFARERFRREIEAIAQLDHPGIVPILAHDQAGDAPYYVMPLVPGASGDDVIQRLQGRDPAQLTGADLRQALGGSDAPDAERVFDGAWWQACLRLVRQVALALDHAHRHGIVHRDIKPSNFLFTADGRALVVDFGLAHVDDDARITRSGAAPGSPAYMPPEQLRGQTVDARADVYALATSLHHLLALRHPLPIDDSDVLRAAILAGRREELRVRGLPGELAIVLAAATDLDPERRHANARAFADDLLAVLERRPIGARPLPRALRVRRWMQRHPTATTSMVLGALLLTATPTLVAIGVAGERDRALVAEAAASRNAYEASISAASSALRAGDRAEAERRLDACPENLRGFEWRHLRQALAGSLREFPGHEAAVVAVAIRGDASWMASADARGRVSVWQPLQGSRATPVALPDRRPIEALSIAADGRRVAIVQAAAGAADPARSGRTVRVVDTATGQVVAERTSAAPGEQVCMAADGDTLLVLDGFVAQELDAFTLVAGRTVPLEPVGSPPAAPCTFDGEWLFACNFRTLQAWRLVDGRASVLPQAFPGSVASAAAADRRGTAVFSTRDGLVIATVEPLRVRRIEGGQRQFPRVAMDASGEFVAAVGADHAFRAWSTSTGRATCQAFGRPELGRAVAVASRRLLAVVGDAGGAIALHGMFGSNERQLLVGHSGIVSTLATVGTGTLLSGSHEPAVRAWDPTSGAPAAATSAVGHWVVAMAVAHDGGHVFVAYQGFVVRLRVPDLAAEGKIVAGGLVLHLCAVPDGGLVAVLRDRLVDIDVARQQVRTSAPLTSGNVRAACSLPDGEHALVAMANAIEYWRLSPRLERIATLPVPGASALACSRDRRSLFTSEERWLRRRRMDNGEVVWERLCARAVTSLLLLPDESRLVAGHEDGTVSLWQTDDCSCMAALRAAEDRVCALAADPAGQWLAAADVRAMVTLFRADGGDEPFARRLARADTMAATWFDDWLRADLRARATVLDAIAAQRHLDVGLRQAMARAERLRPSLTWETVDEALGLVCKPEQAIADYERALQIAEVGLREDNAFELPRLVAAVANLRLGRAEEALRHADLALRGSNKVFHAYARVVRATASWQLGRHADARAELARLEGHRIEPADADLERLLAELRRLVSR